MEEWKEYKLGEIARPIKDRIDTSVLDKTSYISTENMLPNKTGITSPSGVPLGNAIRFQEGDVLISNIRPYFKKIWRADNVGGCSADVICLRATDKVEPLYLFYLLSQDVFFDYVMQGAKGTKMPRGDRNQIMQWPVFLPSKQKQKETSSFLKSLDDKIDCNRRINDNLEQQAQALFKSWFVDFEPFKDGEFVESELGMIPKGWKIVRFDFFIKASSEKVGVGVLPEYSVTNNGIIPRDSKFNKQLSKTTSKNKVLRKNDLVFGMSREILNWGIMEDEIGGVSSAYNVYIINQNVVPSTYLRLFISAKINYFNDLIGTAAREGQSLDKGALMKKVVYVPPTDVYYNYLNIHNSLVKQKDEVYKESCLLTMLRDNLLPKLMSGELKTSKLTM